MKNAILKKFEENHLRAKPLPDFRAGDTVCVNVKIQEGVNKDGSPKSRIQPFEGLVIRYRKGTVNATFLVRKIGASSVGIERDFFVHSPLVESVVVKVRGKVRQSRIFYIRKLRGKAARITSRHHH